jgi:hypothetical protein
MLFESLNNPVVPDKSIAERADEQLTMREHSELERGIVVTNRTGLYAFKFYRAHGMSRQRRKEENFQPKVIRVNNPRKTYALP